MSFLRQGGSALVAALGAVAVSGLTGVAIVASYQSFLRTSRQAYLRSIMTSTDNKIRFLAMQPFAYTCADQRTGASAANQLDGIRSCVINQAYFKEVSKVIIPGACPNGTCGLALKFKTDTAGNALLNFTTITNPNTGETEDQGLFPYQLVYDGTDSFKEAQLRFGGFDLVKQPTEGLPIPREVLQSRAFDCAAVDPTRPVFGGFSAAGQPICRGFNTCPTGTYATGLSFRNLNAGTNTLALACRPLRTPDKMVDCRPPKWPDQYKIESLTFDQGVLTSSCSELPVPDLNYGPPDPINGKCGSAAGSNPTTAPTTDLCSAGTASAVSGGNPWTWSCSGQFGGAGVTCSSDKPAANLVYMAVDESTAVLLGPYNLWQDKSGKLCDNGHIYSATFGAYYVMPAIPIAAVAGNPADCPDVTATPIAENVPCSTEGARCYWTRTQQGSDYPFTGPIQVHTHVSNCNFLECRDASKCPDGTSVGSDGSCPGQSGRWYIGNTRYPFPVTKPECSSYSGPCSPWGSTCAYPYAYPPGAWLEGTCR